MTEMSHKSKNEIATWSWPIAFAGASVVLVLATAVAVYNRMSA